MDILSQKKRTMSVTEPSGLQSFLCRPPLTICGLRVWGGTAAHRFWRLHLCVFGEAMTHDVWKLCSVVYLSSLTFLLVTPHPHLVSPVNTWVPCDVLCIRLIGGGRKSYSHCNLSRERILKTPSTIIIIFIINIILILEAFLQKVKHGIPSLHIIFLSWEVVLLSLEGDTMKSNLNCFCSDHLC